jgi:hypothetical protein
LLLLLHAAPTSLCLVSHSFLTRRAIGARQVSDFPTLVALSFEPAIEGWSPLLSFGLDSQLWWSPYRKGDDSYLLCTSLKRALFNSAQDIGVEKTVVLGCDKDWEERWPK